MLLWLDPQHEFERLVEPLDPILSAHGAHFLRSASKERATQLGLKLELLRLAAAPEARAVIYLPGFDRADIEPGREGSAPTLWSVYEYRFKGCIWGNGKYVEPGAVPDLPTLYGWLRQHGVKAADEATRRRLVAGGADCPLARYAEKQIATAIADWPQPLRLSDVEAALAGDWRDSLRGLLAAPNNEVKRWSDERPTVLSHIAAELGLKGLDDTLSAEELADLASLNLALVEAWDAFGRPPDFPYLARLPETADHQTRQIAFVRDDLLSHAELGPRFRDRVRRLEGGYDLSAWSKDRAGYPGGLPRLAQSQWQAFLARLAASAKGGWKDARDFLRSERDSIHRADATASRALDSELRWDTAASLADLVVKAEEILEQAEALKSPAEFVNSYTAEWWTVDEIHLQVLAGASDAHLETVRDVAERAYFDWAGRLADRFFELAEQEGIWPPAGLADVAALSHGVWTATGSRVGVIITDACRWDIAQALARTLGDGEVALTPVLATLPTITPFGMAALLPLGAEPLEMELGSGRVDIRQGGDRTLDTRDGRKAFLRAHVLDAKGRPDVDFLDLEALLKGSKVPASKFVAVFDNGLDEMGHKGTKQLPGLIPTFVRNLRRAIQLLHEAGFQTVHLLTDHGFLLLAPALVDGLGRPEVLPNQNYYKGDRWAALRPEAPVADVFHIRAPLAPNVMLGFPKGLRTLVKAQAFLHGGISLQECVIPHLISTRVLPRTQLGLELRVSTDKLYGGTVPVILRPEVGEGQGMLGGVDPISVRVWVEVADGRTVAGPVDQELRPDVQELKPALYLREGSKLAAGEALVLRAQQIPTKRDLGSVPLTLMVDWD